MSHFDKAINTVLKHEGLFSNDPSDPGGATKYGISLRFLRTLEGLGDVDNDGDIDVNDIMKMSLQDAIGIYKSQWWDKYRYEEILDISLATKVLDLSVNMGASQAHKLVQKALGLKADGVLGDKSIAALNNEEHPANALTRIAEEAARFYIAVTKTRIKKYGLEEGFKYLFGWIRRAYALT
jgi:lysozyme family protein